ncbi:hypothetical protein BH23ACT5_BH23ACT5_01280 [soil metagenome]
MQWFGLGVGVMVAMLAASAIRAASGATEDVWEVVTVVLALNAPVAVARFRLYDLDRLVSRTVSYTVVAGVVACVYAGAVLIARNVFSAQSQLTVAASTLAAAAAFAPLRRGVQGWVDRRFNRARYDAQLEVERFGRRLRGQLEARALSDELVEVVHETMQPTVATVWIRDFPLRLPAGRVRVATAPTSGPRIRGRPLPRRSPAEVESQGETRRGTTTPATPCPAGWPPRGRGK